MENKLSVYISPLCKAGLYMSCFIWCYKLLSSNIKRDKPDELSLWIQRGGGSWGVLNLIFQYRYLIPCIWSVKWSYITWEDFKATLVFSQTPPSPFNIRCVPLLCRIYRKYFSFRGTATVVSIERLWIGRVSNARFTFLQGHTQIYIQTPLYWDKRLGPLCVTTVRSAQYSLWERSIDAHQTVSLICGVTAQTNIRSTPRVCWV